MTRHEVIREPGPLTITSDYASSVVRRFFDLRSPVTQYLGVPRSQRRRGRQRSRPAGASVMLSCRPAGAPDGPFWRWILISDNTRPTGRLFITDGRLRLGGGKPSEGGGEQPRVTGPGH